MNQYWISRVCLCLFFAFSAFANASPTSPLRFNSLRSAVPLDMSIVSMLQDRQGFIWVGTYHTGLYRYDGYRALRFAHRPADPSSLPNDRVSALYEDGGGRLWVGTQEGLARYNPVTNNFTLFAPPSGAKNHRLIKKIISDGKGGMWLATWGGLQHFDPATSNFVQYAHSPADSDSLFSNDVNAIARDERGGLWVSTWPAGLDYLPEGSQKFQHFRMDSAEVPDAKLNHVRALFFDHEWRLWIGTELGAYRWKDGTPWESRARVPSPQSRISGFYQDKTEAVWAGTLYAGLLKWERGQDTPVNLVHRNDDPYSLPSNDVRAVMQDRAGLLWLGFADAGMATTNITSRGFARLLPYTGDGSSYAGNNAFLTMARATDNKLWVGGIRGLSLFDPATGEVSESHLDDRERKGELAAKSVYTLYQQPGGPLWVGTSAGLYEFDAASKNFKVHNFGQAGANFINMIAPGSEGRLWLGTGRTVVNFDPATGHSRVFAHDDANPATVSATGAGWVLEDRLGRVWAGTEWTSGFDMIDKRTGLVRHFYFDKTRQSGLSDDKVGAIYEDKKGRLWIGTSTGLNQIVTSPKGEISFRSYASTRSIGQVKIISIQGDETGTLWIATVSEIISFDPDSGVVRRYSSADGLTGSYTVGASHGAPDGVLYFGGVQGITVVQPALVQSRSLAPPISITDVSVAGHSLDDAPRRPGVLLDGPTTAPKSLTLPPEESVFSIEFAALDFGSPGLHRYHYKLQGFDKSWTETDATHRNASYTNLDPGAYQFEVRAISADGLWSERAASIEIRIEPPFWKTLWFRLAAVMLFASLLFLLYRTRVSTLRRTQARLEQLVLDRTKDLEASNAKLANLATTDGLTGITNRRGFDTAFKAEWARSLRSGEPIAVAMIDVDFFKLYNDHYGHQAGDACLTQVAQMIARHVRRANDLAARYGGEEFILLLSGCRGPDGLAVADALCKRIFAAALPHARSAHGCVSVSIGVFSMVASPDSSPEHLIAQADQALYLAKQEGRNRASLMGSAGTPSATPLE